MIIPNIITLSNLLLGILSLLYTMNQQYQTAAILILAAVFLDGMDGRIARRLNVETNFGKELDSLCDLVSFGVAPALLVYDKYLQEIGFFGLLIALSFALCGAVRLARFNVMNIKTYFIGVPITIAGGIMAITILLSSILPAFIFPYLTVSLAYLMVSNFKIPKF